MVNFRSPFFAALTGEILSWKVEDKFQICLCPCFILYTILLQGVYYLTCFNVWLCRNHKVSWKGGSSCSCLFASSKNEFDLHKNKSKMQFLKNDFAQRGLKRNFEFQFALLGKLLSNWLKIHVVLGENVFYWKFFLMTS